MVASTRIFKNTTISSTNFHVCYAQVFLPASHGILISVKNLVYF